jgi:transmembrane sensor
VKPKVEVVPQPVIAETLTWQKPRLVFVDTPLADVVRQFNRYNRTQLVLGDPGMGALPVGGSFMPDNVDAFVRLMQSTRNLTVEQRGDGALVLHRGPVR